jgi:hypothetical protein
MELQNLKLFILKAGNYVLGKTHHGQKKETEVAKFQNKQLYNKRKKEAFL